MNVPSPTPYTYMSTQLRVVIEVKEGGIFGEGGNVGNTVKYFRCVS